MTCPQSSLERFLEIISKLREPEKGCPWDLKQTFSSLAPLLIEEAYEVSDATEKDHQAIKEELGDMLSLIGLFAQVATEQRLFDFNAVLDTISEKLVRRHPHVFGETKVADTAEVLKNWEAIKQQERNSQTSSSKGLLDNLPRALPSLLKAQQIGERCSRVGFDWTSSSAVADKVFEEVREFIDTTQTSQHSEPTSEREDHPAQPPSAHTIEEFGDLLFSLAQYSRHLGFNPEQALQAANSKFIKRFQALESLASQQMPGKPIAELGADTLEKLWNEAKAIQSGATRAP
jgi:ATP diphosphatase